MSAATATVAIPTRNRRGRLIPLLERLIPQAADVGADILVVDNGSSDGTVEAVRALAGDRVRCIVEPGAGATRARNAGARAARGEVAAFIDDDALPRPGWLAALLGPFSDGRVGCVGGRVRLRFEGAGPAWINDALAAYLAAYDLGDEPVDLATRPRHEAPRGLNMAVRRRALLEVGGFDVRLGPRGSRPSVGEESELCLRLLGRGYGVRYDPRAEVEHLVDPARLDAAWFLRRAFWTGWGEGFIDARYQALRKVAGRLRWHYGRALLGLPHAASPGYERNRLSAACGRREACGYILAFLRYRAWWSGRVGMQRGAASARAKSADA